MEKSTKLYKKAMESYQIGEIDTALNFCEKSISINLRNAAVVNLKGLLLYLKGDLDGARAIWKLNVDINKDSVSKKYLSGIKMDEERKVLYEKALILIKNIQIKEALIILKNCEDSDFNVINVSNSIASCLLKQGRYEETLVYINKALSFDKKNKIAIENKKMLVDYGIIKKDINLKNFQQPLIILGCLLVIFYAAFQGKYIIKKSEVILNKTINSLNANKNSDKNKGNQELVNSKLKPQNDAGKPNTTSTEKTSSIQSTEQFPSAELKSAIDSKNYEELYNYCTKWKDKSLGINDKSVLNKANDILSSEGVAFFYNTACDDRKNNKYDEAKDNFNKAYTYGKVSYLYPHIIYFSAVTYEETQDIQKAIEYYEMYYSAYGNGDYASTTAYKLALLYNNIDKNKAKAYAKEIKDKFSNSIYYNSNIKEILQS